MTASGQVAVKKVFLHTLDFVQSIFSSLSALTLTMLPVLSSSLTSKSVTTSASWFQPIRGGLWECSGSVVECLTRD